MIFRRLRDRRGYFPSSENSSNATTENNDVDNDAEVTTPPLPDALPEDVEPALAQAWFTKRQQQQRQDRSSSAPVDLDDIVVLTPEHAKKRHKMRVYPDDMSSAASISAASIALSDKTPIMSNLPRSTLTGSAAASQIPLAGDCDPNGSIASSSAAPVGWKPSRLVKFLALLFLASLATLVATSVVTRKRRQSSSNDIQSVAVDDGFREDDGIKTIQDTPVRTPSIISSSPTAADVINIVAFAPPAPSMMSGTSSTIEPTSEAAFSLSTDAPSIGVSFATITRSPISPTPGPTDMRSLRPTPSPTPTSTPEPTPEPTLKPTVPPVLPVTRRPVSTSPTVVKEAVPSPTKAPTQTLDALVESLKVAANLSGSAQGEQFGTTLALSENGSVLAISSFSTFFDGSQVQVYEFLDGSWSMRGDPIAGLADTADSARMVVSLNRDGSILAIAEPKYLDHAGTVRVLRYNGQEYKSLGQRLEGIASSFFGNAVKLSPSGRRMVVGAHLFSDGLQFRGQVVIYDLLSGEWTMKGAPIVGRGTFSLLGSAVDIYEDTDDLIVAASAIRDKDTSGYVEMYKWKNKAWEKLGGDGVANSLVDPSGSVEDEFGLFISIAKTQSARFRLAVGAPLKDDSATGKQNVGMTVVYELVDAAWSIIDEPIFSDGLGDEAGNSIQLLDDGNLLIVGVTGSESSSGSVRFYRYDKNTFRGNINTPDTLVGQSPKDDFGVAIAATWRQGKSDHLVVAIGAMGGSEDEGKPGYVVVLEES